MISIIVPVYNCGGSLRRCVDSLQKQTFEDLQIILVDDGSTDDTPAVCDELAAGDGRITVIRRPNGGVSSARNAGIAAAKGEFVTFADADDYVNPDHLMNLADVMRRHDCDVSVCGYLTEDEDKCTPQKSGAGGYDEAYHGHDSAVCELLAGGAVGGYVWNKLYRRELLEGVSFRSGVKILEDMLFNMDVFRRVKSMAVSGYRSYHYIQRGQSAMHRQFGDEHRAMVETARTIRDELAGENPVLRDAGRGLLATTILWVVDVMAEYGPYDRELVRQYRAEFRPLKKTYLRLKRVPFSYRASAVFFDMGFGVYKIAVKAARKLL